jgi:hypothetical protein
MLKTYDDMLQLVSSKSPQAQIIDARPPNSFHGRFFFLPSLFKLLLFVLGATAGHLPRSLNIPYTDVFDQSNQCLKSNDDLQRRNRSVTSFASLTRMLLVRFSVLQGGSGSIQRRHLYVSNGNNSEYLGVRCSCPRSKISLRL